MAVNYSFGGRPVGSKKYVIESIRRHAPGSADDDSGADITIKMRSDDHRASMDSAEFLMCTGVTKCSYELFARGEHRAYSEHSQLLEALKQYDKERLQTAEVAMRSMVCFRKTKGPAFLMANEVDPPR